MFLCDLRVGSFDFTTFLLFCFDCCGVRGNELSVRKELARASSVSSSYVGPGRFAGTSGGGIFDPAFRRIVRWRFL
jgi:hypothetical protein